MEDVLAPQMMKIEEVKVKKTRERREGRGRKEGRKENELRVFLPFFSSSPFCTARWENEYGLVA